MHPMTRLRSRLPHLLGLALSCVCAASPASAQGGRLYGMIDADFLGHDIAFSVDLGGAHQVRYYPWGRDIKEVEGMAIDREGELYLFDETGEVKKVRLASPNARPTAVAPKAEYDFTGASARPLDGMIELFDNRGLQFVTFDPRTDAFREPPRRGTRTAAWPELSGLARIGTQLYGSAMNVSRLQIYACTTAGCRPACALQLGPAEDVQAIERYSGTALVLARISITDANQLMLHVESLDPRTCTRQRILETQLDRRRIQEFLKPSINLDEMLTEARRRNRSPEIEAIAFQP
jgi:hypothetical protein